MLNCEFSHLLLVLMLISLSLVAGRRPTLTLTAVVSKYSNEHSEMLNNGSLTQMGSLIKVILHFVYFYFIERQWQ